MLNVLLGRITFSWQLLDALFSHHEVTHWGKPQNRGKVEFFLTFSKKCMLPTWFIMASLRYQLSVLPPKSCFCSTCHILWSKWPWKVRSYFAFSLSSIRYQHIHSCLCRLLSIYFVFVSYCNISFNRGLHLWCPQTLIRWPFSTLCTTSSSFNISECESQNKYFLI